MRPNFLHLMHQDTLHGFVWHALDGYVTLGPDGARFTLLQDLLSRKRDHVSRNVFNEFFNEFF